MIPIVHPALSLDEFRAGPQQTTPSDDGYALVMLRAASLRPGRRSRLQRTALALLGPQATLGRYTHAGSGFTRWSTYVPRSDGGT